MTMSDGVSPSPKGGPEPARPSLNPPLVTVECMKTMSCVRILVGRVFHELGEAIANAFPAEVECTEPQDGHTLQTAD